jgi:hypothetical protein
MNTYTAFTHAIIVAVGEISTLLYIACVFHILGVSVHVPVPVSVPIPISVPVPVLVPCYI